MDNFQWMFLNRWENGVWRKALDAVRTTVLMDKGELRKCLHSLVCSGSARQPMTSAWTSPGKMSKVEEVVVGSVWYTANMVSCSTSLRPKEWHHPPADER